MNEREKMLAECRQIVVKAGTRLLTDPELIPVLIKGIVKLRNAGYRVLLVSSGAVGTGIKMLGLSERPRKLADIQMLAALGQGRLMEFYNEVCEKEGFFAAQLLLTSADLHHRERYLNVKNCIDSLWNRGILPIVNENDSVSVDELKFSDNDILSGMLAAMTKSELTIILTTESGLRKRNEDGKLGRRISVVKELTPDIMGNAGGTDNSTFSIGGMSSKLHAAELVTRRRKLLRHCPTGAIRTCWEDHGGEDVGTLFMPPVGVRVSGLKLWIRDFSKVMGRLIIDDGAARALRERGASLLPAGIRRVVGYFEAGDTVEIVRTSGEVVAYGISNFSSAKCVEIQGLHGNAAEVLIGKNAPEEVVHRDKLTLRA